MQAKQPWEVSDPVHDAISGVIRTISRPTGRDSLTASVSFGLKPQSPPNTVRVVTSNRPVGKIPHLSEARRIDLMLIPAILWRVFAFGASDPHHPEAENFRGLLADAMVEPVNGLGLNKAEQMGDRVRRAARDVCDALFVGMPNAKVIAIVFYGVQIMLEDGTLELYEGSAMADALYMAMEFAEHYVSKPGVEKSAQKQARKFVDHLKKKGHFQ